MNFEVPKNYSENISELQEITRHLENRLILFFKDRAQIREGTNENRKKKDRRILAEKLRAVRDDMVVAYPNWSEAIIVMTEAFRPSTDWISTTVHFLDVNKDRTGVLDEVWKFWEKHKAFNNSVRVGILAHAGAYQLLGTVGLNPRISTPSEDANKGVDLFLEDIPVQLKGRTGHLLKAKKEGLEMVSFSTGLNLKTGIRIDMSIDINHLDEHSGAPDAILLEKGMREAEKLKAKLSELKLSINKNEDAE